MLIIPAVDIKNKKCVRLTQGKPDTEVIYDENPVRAAMRWQTEGAQYLHVVDLDGAFAGKTTNFAVIKDLLSAVSIPVEVGGGIRTLEDIGKYLEIGADRVVLGTQIVTEPGFLEKAIDRYKNKIAVAIDTGAGKIRIEGWAKTTEISPLFFAQNAIKTGVKTIIYTDITTDGTMKGPNFKGIENFVEAVRTDIIVSGGISTLDDIKKLKALGISGIIIGKALYTGLLKGKDLWT